jgi:hypothetical protein
MRMLQGSLPEKKEEFRSGNAREMGAQQGSYWTDESSSVIFTLP